MKKATGVELASKITKKIASLNITATTQNDSTRV
jgi:hypothetical protein